MAKKFLCCKVNDGKKASFWHDNWTSLGSLIDLTGSTGPRVMGLPTASSVLEAVNVSTGEWILPSSRVRLPGLDIIRQVLINTPHPEATLGTDQFLWKLDGTSNTVFSSKLTWNSTRPTQETVNWSTDIWFKGNVPKHAFMFWIAHLDRLPLRTRLLSWGIHVSDSCCLCGRASETRDHLFFHCELSSLLWDKIWRRIGISQVAISEWNNLIELMSVRGHHNRNLIRLVVQSTVYHIWKEMNNRLHNVVSLPMSTVFSMIDRNIRDSIIERIHQRRFSNLLSLWFINA